VSVFTRLSRVGLEIFPITIEDEIKQFSVSRLDFLSPHFGGNAVQTHPPISEEKLQKHGFDNFMYAQLVSVQTVNGSPKIFTVFVSHFTHMRHHFQEHQVCGCVLVDPALAQWKMYGCWCG
jgi:hypothetical protein